MSEKLKQEVYEADMRPPKYGPVTFPRGVVRGEGEGPVCKMEIRI